MQRGNRTGTLIQRARNRMKEPTFVNQCIKWTMFFFNLIFWVLGCAVMGAGVYAYLEQLRFAGEADEDGNIKSAGIDSAADILLNISVVFIAAGAVIFFISFMGCIGALRENTLFLNIFTGFMVVILLAEVAIVVCAFVFQSKAQEYIENTLLGDRPITRYRENIDLQNLIDFLQETLGCCGVGSAGYKDWDNNEYFKCNTNNPESCGVPYSCCKRDPSNLNTDIRNTLCGYKKQEDDKAAASQVIYTEGCVEVAVALIEPNLKIIIGIGAGIAVIQIVAIFLSRTLTVQVQDQLARWKRRG